MGLSSSTSALGSQGDGEVCSKGKLNSEFDVLHVVTTIHKCGSLNFVFDVFKVFNRIFLTKS